MKTIIRWLPIWLVGSLCVVIGFLNGRHFANVTPPETRPEEWARYDAQVVWYAYGLVVLWIQLFVWAFVNPTKSSWWHAGLFLAFLISGATFLVVAALLITDSMVP